MSSDQQRITGYGVGAPTIKLNPPPIISTRNPTSGDIRYPLGQEGWVNKASGTIFALTVVTAGQATWVNLGAGSGDITQLSPSSGTSPVFPSGGNINITAGSGITTTGSGTRLLLLLQVLEKSRL